MALVYAKPESLDLHGDQVGLVQIEFADANYNILGAAKTDVITSSSPDVYRLGGVTLTSLPGTAFVHMQVGVYDSTGAGVPGHALFDDPALQKAAGSVLSNPGWDPTTTNGLDGSRSWTYTSNSIADCAYPLNDQWGASRDAVLDGSKGFLKVQVDGTSNDFQYAQSQWLPTKAGVTWLASIYAKPESLDLHGSEVGLVKIEFAGVNSNILTAASTVVITSSSPDAYWPGTVALASPSNTALVRMQVGISDPEGSGNQGHALFDDAALIPMGEDALKNYPRLVWRLILFPVHAQVPDLINHPATNPNAP